MEPGCDDVLNQHSIPVTVGIFQQNEATRHYANLACQWIGREEVTLWFDRQGHLSVSDFFMSPTKSYGCRREGIYFHSTNTDEEPKIIIF